MSKTFGKGSRQKKKRCIKTTAYPCKYACILRSKKCKNPLKGQAETSVKWLKDTQERLDKINQDRIKKGKNKIVFEDGKGFIQVETPKVSEPSKEQLGVKVVTPIDWNIEAKMRRQEGKFWVARLMGKDDKYTFKRQFLKASDIEWGKYGMKKAKFEISSPGIYHDSDGDYFKAFVDDNGEMDIKTISYMEAREFFYKELSK